MRIEERSARTALNAARDELSAIAQPPVLDGIRIAKAWADLVGWATGTAAKAEESRDKAAALAEKRVCDSNKLDSEIRRLLTEADVGAEDSRSPCEWAASAVAAAGAPATETVRHIKKARGRRASTTSEITKAREHSAVAKQLGALLAIDGFPRWLNLNALEVLAESASDTLMDLSGGQFELSLSEGKDANFAIIDHADADAVRPVKTLSGGETFQASLALALALAHNLGALANDGAAMLHALFVDEGFGTLDEATLEVVADTLESLATNAGRMVGVITHVPGLAARVPVRFRVNRDPRVSSAAAQVEPTSSQSRAVACWLTPADVWKVAHTVVPAGRTLMTALSLGLQKRDPRSSCSAPDGTGTRGTSACPPSAEHPGPAWYASSAPPTCPRLK